MEGREGGGLFRAFNPAATSSSKSASTSASTSAGRQPPSPSAELPVSRGPSEVLPQGRHYRAHRPDDASRPAADVSTRASTGRGHSGSHQPVHPLAAATSASGVRHETASASVAGRPNSTDSAPAVAAASSALGTPAGATVQTATPPVASGLPATAAAAPTATGQAHLGTPAAPPPTAPATAAQTGAAAATAAAAAATVTHTEAAAAASTSGGSSRPKLRMRKGEKGAVNEYQTLDYLETSSHALTLETETLLSSSLSPYSSPSEQYSIEHSIQYDPRLQWIPQAVRLLCVALLLLSAWLVVAIFQMHSVALKVALMRGVPVGSLSSTNWVRQSVPKKSTLVVLAVLVLCQKEYIESRCCFCSTRSACDLLAPDLLYSFCPLFSFLFSRLLCPSVFAGCSMEAGPAIVHQQRTGGAAPAVEGHRSDHQHKLRGRRARNLGLPSLGLWAPFRPSRRHLANGYPRYGS